jgi:hypothetical protein
VKGAYRVALLCGAFPLLAGVSVFLLWCVTRADELMKVGVVVLFGGLACFAAGAIALGRFCGLGLRAPELPRRRLWLRTIGAGALLLSNFPVAGAIIYGAVAIETCYTVLIRNDSERQLEGVRVVGGGCDISFGSVPPGDDVRRRFWIEHADSLVLQVSGRSPEVIDGYVCANMGGHTTVTIRPDGTASVDWARDGPPRAPP